MKYIILSFDDGREDFFLRAFPILRKYNLTATLNVVSECVGKKNPSGIGSGNGVYVSWEELAACKEYGIEIANHSARHNNNLEDILIGAAEICDCLDIQEPLGFSSPNSEICAKNMAIYEPLVNEGRILYIRSGNQVKRDGYIYALAYILSKYTHSKKMFKRYNNRNILNLGEQRGSFLPSITCNRDNTARQIEYFIEKMEDNTAAILMFHSILQVCDLGYEKDKWYNTAEEFERLCKYLAENPEVSVITTKALINLMK